jgi:3-hydroxyisobutyrate dehydrogenase-like beta-hydroxyacid dehydrogenase
MGTASALDTRRIGWIGLGKMGLPICERLAAQGFEVATLTRNPEGRERATRANLQSESKIGDVVASADIVVSAISDDAALLDIVFQAGGLKETLDVSQLFVEISTVSPSASRRVAEAMSAIGVGYIRSPVSGSTALAAQGALTAVISGPAGALASLKDFYAALHSQDVRCRR